MSTRQNEGCLWTSKKSLNEWTIITWKEWERRRKNEDDWEWEVDWCGTFSAEKVAPVGAFSSRVLGLDQFVQGREAIRILFLVFFFRSHANPLTLLFLLTCYRYTRKKLGTYYSKREEKLDTEITLTIKE